MLAVSGTEQGKSGLYVNARMKLIRATAGGGWEWQLERVG